MTRGARLEVVAGKASGLTLEVEDDLLIGRHAQGAGRLAEDEELSRSHARISVDSAGSCGIEDLGSTNGTFVNGLRIVAPHPLTEGDTTEMGATTLAVRSLASAPPRPAPPARPAIVPKPFAAPNPFTQPEPVVAPVPAPEPPTEALSGPPPVAAPPARVEVGRHSLRLDIDFDARELVVRLGDQSDPVHLVCDGHAWRVASTPIDPDQGESL
jgi:hypothetical protein